MEDAVVANTAQHLGAGAGELEADRERVVAAAANHALPGTLLERHIRCNKSGCRCMADPPELHGPYYQWTRKIDGRTRTTLLTAEQLDRYRPWFDNAKTIRTLTAELEAL